MNKLKRVVIFWLNLKPEKKHDYDEDIVINPEFPNDGEFWRIWKSKDSSYARTFDNAKQAEEFLKLHIQPNFVYKVCEWEITENFKMVSSVPQLVEVDEI